MRLPFRHSIEIVGDSKFIVQQRFFNLEQELGIILFSPNSILFQWVSWKKLKKYVTLYTTCLCLEDRYSSWSRMNRITVYILRFAYYAHFQIISNRIIGPSSALELFSLVIILLKIVKENPIGCIWTRNCRS